MYSSPGAPFISRSMMAVTALSTVRAEAPGYVAEMLTLGGAMFGYCATGRLGSASTPARMMASAITQAKTGRSIKKRAMVSPSAAWRPCARLSAPA